MIEIRPYEPRDLEALRSLIREPALAREFDVLQTPQAIEAWIADPFRDPALHFVGWEDGALAGFGCPFLMPGRAGRFSVARLGVRGGSRRRGIGRALLDRMSRGLAERHPDVHELCLNFWVPSPEAEGFVSRHGFTKARTFWLMERPRGPVAAPAWPAGIRLAGDDGTDRVYRDFTDVYNDSFEHHYHSAIMTLEETRAIFTGPGVRADGSVLAYRGERGAGFCRCVLHADRGEVAGMGTIQAERGIGLGRALLRWGVEWLERANASRVTLLVDGENESALKLYRSEGFDVVRTRVAWSRPNPPAPAR